MVCNMWHGPWNSMGVGRAYGGLGRVLGACGERLSVRVRWGWSDE